MKSTSCITTVLSHLTFPQYTLERLTGNSIWAGISHDKRMEESTDIFSKDHECISFSSGISKVKGEVEISFFTNHFDSAACLHVPVTVDFLFTFIKNKGNQINVAWSTSLS